MSAKTPRAVSAKVEVPAIYADAIRLASQGHLAQLKALPAGAVASARDPFGGASALSGAAKNGDLLTVQFLLSDEVKLDATVAGAGGVTPLMLAAVGAFEFVVAELLKAPGVAESVAAADETGNTALHYASKSGSVAVLKLLIDAGGASLVRAKNRVGRSAIFVAAMHGHGVLVAALLAAGGGAVDADLNGVSAQQAALAAGFPKIAAMLPAS